MKTDILLINPNSKTPSPFAAVEPPFWLGLIAWYEMKNGKEVFIVDAEAHELSIEETVETVWAINPKETLIVCMGNNPSVSSTPKWNITKMLLERIDAKVTGLHPIAIDYPGVVRHPFEGLPHIPYFMLPMDKYKAHNWHCLDGSSRNPYAVLYTSLNCPFSCSYCNIHTLYGDRKIQYRKMTSILHDIYSLVCEYQVRNIKIWDELFCLDESRVIQICDYIISEGYDLNIWAYARTDTITDKMLLKMKKAGINWLAYGFESSTDHKSRQAERAIQMTRYAGINILGNFMFGLPNESMDDMKRTLDFAIKENFEYANFYVALPYPGSSWYDSLTIKPTDWSSFSQFSPNICADPSVVKFRDEAFQTYFNNPDYLSMIRKKFGEQGESHIREMVKWKIR